MARNKDVLMHHDYDGIQELDNDLPSWWLWLFYVTVIIAAVYLLHFHVLHTGKSALTKYEQSINANYQPPEKGAHDVELRYHSPYFNAKVEVTPRIKKQFAAYIGPEIGFNELVKEAMARADAANLAKLEAAFPELYAELTEHGGPITPKETIVPAAPEDAGKKYEPVTDANSLALGKDIYVKNCATCHGQQGQGGIGPNITDDYWLHGAGMDNMVATIKNGVPAKGMISWRPILNERQIVEVASYMLSLHGTNPPNPKAPQGELVDVVASLN